MLFRSAVKKESGRSDECGICDGDGISCLDCNNDLFGSAYIDNCDICVGGNTGLSSSCPNDCNEEPGGNAYIDQCGSCVTEPNPDCILDCSGTWGGAAARIYGLW